MIVACLQRSDAWFALRCGRVTASRVADVLARTKVGWAAARAQYMVQLVVERLSGIAEPSLASPAMRWGTEKEPEARAAYRFYHDADVSNVDFVLHPEIFMAGASPDGLVGRDGLLEIKCPTSATHINTIRSGDIPEKYQLQMLWQMACTGRNWCDFLSYDPRMPEPLRLFVRRLDRDEDRITELEKHVRDFIAGIDDVIASLRTGPATAAIDTGMLRLVVG